MAIVALIVAGGTGTRFASSRPDAAQLPKQYQKLGNMRIIDHVTHAFEQHSDIDQIQIVCAKNHIDQIDEMRSQFAKLKRPVVGGSTRQESVLEGLKTLKSEFDDDDLVLIHDAARPLLSATLIDSLIDMATQKGNAIPAMMVTDTLKKSDDGAVTERTQSRTGLFAVQTPQTFRLGDILTAHRYATEKNIQGTDDAGLMEAMGEKVHLVKGAPENIKITTQSDLQRARQMIGSHMEPRTGIGYDVHAIDSEKNAVILCGIELDHEFGLDGHSDADVAMHAITDALYGALADGDIGQHFPPSDMAHKDKNSEIFLRHAVERVHLAQGKITHIDLTILAEAPKIGPHAPKMRANIARICGIAEKRVSVKATTSEKLGFVGRHEGLAAMSTATIMVPAND